VDYLEPDYLKRLAKRGTSRKRHLAIQQFELGKMILGAFLNGNHFQREKLVAAFIGMENVNFGDLDKTL
jgi:hypothetical protein